MNTWEPIRAENSENISALFCSFSSCLDSVLTSRTSQINAVIHAAIPKPLTLHFFRSEPAWNVQKSPFTPKILYHFKFPPLRGGNVISLQINENIENIVSPDSRQESHDRLLHTVRTRLPESPPDRSSGSHSIHECVVPCCCVCSHLNRTLIEHTKPTLLFSHDAKRKSDWLKFHQVPLWPNCLRTSTTAREPGRTL